VKEVDSMEDKIIEGSLISLLRKIKRDAGIEEILVHTRDGRRMVLEPLREDEWKVTAVYEI